GPGSLRRATLRATGYRARRAGPCQIPRGSDAARCRPADPYSPAEAGVAPAVQTLAVAEGQAAERSEPAAAPPLSALVAAAHSVTAVAAEQPRKLRPSPGRYAHLVQSVPQVQKPAAVAASALAVQSAHSVQPLPVAQSARPLQSAWFRHPLLAQPPQWEAVQALAAQLLERRVLHPSSKSSCPLLSLREEPSLWPCRASTDLRSQSAPLCAGLERAGLRARYPATAAPSFPRRQPQLPAMRTALHPKARQQSIARGFPATPCWPLYPERPGSRPRRLLAARFSQERAGRQPVAMAGTHADMRRLLLSQPALPVRS